MSAHDEAVEAAAKAYGQPEFVRRGISDHLRYMRAAGYVVTRVPEEQEYDGFWDEPETIARIGGYNACRAERLANAVEGDAPMVALPAASGT